MSRLATAHHSQYLPCMLSFSVFYLKKLRKGLSPGLNSTFLTLLDASQTLAVMSDCGIVLLPCLFIHSIFILTFIA